MAQFHMGRSERFFESAKEFRPERWLDELETKGPFGLQADEILRPFSMGPRNCIGKQYVHIQIPYRPTMEALTF